MIKPVLTILATALFGIAGTSLALAQSYPQAPGATYSRDPNYPPGGYPADYRDGRDAMGWHSDDEPELGPAPSIASLSLGAMRRFRLCHREDPAKKLSIDLQPGSVLLMAGATQRNYRHELPRTARAVGARINVTFRTILVDAARPLASRS